MKLVLLAEAEAEIEEAAAWYDARQEGLGDEFLLAMATAIEALCAVPETWPHWPGAPPHSPPIRRFLMPRFPYHLAYQVFPDLIVLLAVAHARRRPLYWIERAD